MHCSSYAHFKLKRLQLCLVVHVGIHVQHFNGYVAMPITSEKYPTIAQHCYKTKPISDKCCRIMAERLTDIVPSTT